jgi:2-polyprenyl-6-methoxyphenol hydroxylase-like FAD-dependent oxidoreductase
VARTTSPDTTGPDTTGPDTTGPDTTGPDTTSPETTGPETTGPDTDATAADVIVVGYGPVGQTLAILLGQLGHRVTVVEQWPEAYQRPRAVHFDDEIARVFASAGVGDELGAISEPCVDYDWRNEAGATLLHFDWGAPGASGWPSANMFSQPALEAVLAARADALAGVTVRRGLRAVAVTVADTDGASGAAVKVETRDREGRAVTVRGRYLVGCDGANSFVRDWMGTEVTDLGFFYDWLIVDVRPHEQREWIPTNLQMCVPTRPTTVVSGGPGRRRWEFMRLPDETVAELNTEETAWRLLEPWGLSPANADLERHTVYTFQARWAREWRAGPVFVAGDAAHLMPPFAGQGMCSGIRDAANLAWKLDLVLRDRAGEGLLDSYTTERSAHVQHAIGMSVELGNVICLTDPAAVAARDEAMLGAGGRPELALPPIPPPVLGPGVVHAADGETPVAPAGTLSGQGRVAAPDGTVGRFDQVIGTGFVVVSAVDLSGHPGEEVRAAVDTLGVRLVQLVRPAGPTAPGVHVVADVDGFYGPWLAALGSDVVVVRPDFYIYGTGRAADLPALLAGLLDAVRGAPHPVG